MKVYISTVKQFSNVDFQLKQEIITKGRPTPELKVLLRDSLMILKRSRKDMRIDLALDERRFYAELAVHGFHGYIKVSYLSVLRAVGRSTGTQPDQKTRIRQLVSSTILIFLVCFSPYHVFLLLRTLFERDCSFIAGIFNYYHVSLLLTSLNCVADPALYCFVSESARRGLHRAVVGPVSRVICCCCRRGNASPVGPAGDSHEVAKDGGQNVTLLTHSYTPLNAKTGSGNATSDPSTVPNKSRAENSEDMGGRTGDRDRKCS